MVGKPFRYLTSTMLYNYALKLIRDDFQIVALKNFVKKWLCVAASLISGVYEKEIV
jgi:hypothetical protein